MISSNEKKQIKIIVVGDAEVGKSSLISRLTEDQFSESYLPTIGFEDITAQITIEHEQIQLNIVDSAGQERFRKEKEYGEIQGAIIVFDVTNPDSFQAVEQYYSKFVVISESIKEKKKDEKMPILLVGNKIDQAHNIKIIQEQGSKLAKDLKITYLETSAKNSHNVKIMFQSLASKIIDLSKSKSDAQANASKHQEFTLFKIIIIGDARVGKSCILQQKSARQFSSEYDATIGVEFASIMLNVNECKCKLQIWDTAGQEKFRQITQSYYRGANAYVLVYDVGNEESFQHVPNFMQDAQKFKTQDAKFILVGNKIDLENRKVTYEQGKSLADSYHIPFLGKDCLILRNICQKQGLG